MTSPSVPGARLLDVVATMDRLRSPGGCPWDAEQTHESLAPYLLEETYEAYEAIEHGDTDALREELGDVLLQVVFHARLAQERAEGAWSIDDVAAGLVEKLERRHPHVFGERVVADADEVNRNWEELKAAEKGRRSVTDGVPLGQPALSLAAKLQKRAERLGLPPELVGPSVAAAETPVSAVASAAAAVLDDETGSETVELVGELLFAAVSLARAQGVDPEAALRGTARRFRDRLAAVEADVLAAGGDPTALDAEEWHDRWTAAAPDLEAPAADDPDLRVADPAAAGPAGDESHHEP